MPEATRVRGSYRNGKRTREQLLAAAMQAFGDSGFRGTSLRDIAGAVQVSAATLLAHFGTKEGLLLAVLDAWDATGRDVEPVGTSGLSWFARYPNLMQFHMANSGLLRLFVTITAESTDASHPAHLWAAERAARLQEQGSVQLAIAPERGEIRSMSSETRKSEIRALYAVMDGYALRWLLRPDFDLARDYRVVFDATLRRWRNDEGDSS